MTRPASFFVSIVASVCLLILVYPHTTHAALTDGMNASDVVGQVDFDSSTSATTQDGFTYPIASAIDTVHHRLFVTDQNNNRVLEYDLNTDNTFTDHTADHVLGQPDFTTNNYVTTQNSMGSPQGLVYDSINNRLFVADADNNRILTFNVSSITDGEDAVNVLGHTDFTTSDYATTQNGMSNPFGVTYDSTNNRLFVSDASNHRILTFNVSSITDGEDAVNVLGQPDFTTSDTATTQNGMNNPQGVVYDTANNRLFVADLNNNRVLTYNVSSITDGEDAINVLGQPDFTTSEIAATQNGMRSPQGITYDSINSRLFLADASNYRILTYNVSSITDGEDAINVLGQPDFTTSDYATTQNGMSNPNGIAYDPDNDLLYVADTSNNRVTLFSFGNPPTPTPTPNTDTPSESDSQPGIDPASDSFGTSATTFRTHIPRIFKPGKQTRITITPPDMDQLQKAKITIFGKTYTFKPHGGKQQTIIISVPNNPKSTRYAITLTYANKQLKQHGTIRMGKAK